MSSDSFAVFRKSMGDDMAKMAQHHYREYVHSDPSTYKQDHETNPPTITASSHRTAKPYKQQPRNSAPTPSSAQPSVSV